MSDHLSDAYINNLTDYLHFMSTSTTPTTTTSTSTYTSTSYALLTDDTPVYRSIDIQAHDTHEHEHEHEHTHTHAKGIEEISLDAFSRSQQNAELYGGFDVTRDFLSDATSHELPVIPTTQHTHIPSFEQQHTVSVSTSHTLPPSSPSLSSDSSSSSTLSYSNSHNDLPLHDVLMRNDSCISTYEPSQQRTMDEIDVVDEEQEQSMPDADSDELPPPGVYPRLCRQNGIYRTRSIAGY